MMLTCANWQWALHTDTSWYGDFLNYFFSGKIHPEDTGDDYDVKLIWTKYRIVIKLSLHFKSTPVDDTCKRILL